MQASHVNRLVRVPGIVVSASRARAYARKIVYRCSRCSTMGDPIFVSPMRKVVIPRQCPRYWLGVLLMRRVAAQGSEGDRCPLDSNYIVANLCSYVDQQTVKLQEIPEDVPTGEMPRHISCVLERNLVDRITPGTRCTLIGYIDTFDQTKQVEMGSSIDCSVWWTRSL